VSLTVTAEDRITLQPLGGAVSGKTDANGYVVLNYYISWDYDPDLIDMMAYVSSSGCTTIQCTGNYTTTGNTLYPEFWVIKDTDQNGIDDDYELLLAEKFCPYLILEAADQGVRPVPVEILDRNGDGKLGWEDLYAVVKYEPNNYDIPVGKIQILGAEGFWHYENVYPKCCIYEDQFIYFEYGSQPYYAWSYVIPHFEWAALDFGDTYPTTDWYDPWRTKLAENNTSPYVDGTTYAHFFVKEGEVVIQYYFFYPFNASANRHEGDWEYINVILNSQNPTTATIQRVEYYFHHKYLNCSTPGVDYYVKNSTHPRVYVAGHICSEYCGEGSHGSYPKAKRWADIGPFDVDEDVHGDGLHIDFNGYKNIVIILDPEEVDNNSELNWLKFKGFWGHLMIYPSAGDIELSTFKALAHAFTLGLASVFDWPEDVGNAAPLGPCWQTPWNNIGTNSGQTIYP